MNTRKSGKAELVSADNVMAKVLWDKLIIEEQSWRVKQNESYRDNTILMKLEEKGNSSSGKVTCHFDIKYIYISDLLNEMR
jgi:hypothetical protein